MKLLHKFHVHIDQKKYNLRIYEQREQNVYMMTIGDYGKYSNRFTVYPCTKNMNSSEFSSKFSRNYRFFTIHNFLDQSEAII